MTDSSSRFGFVAFAETWNGHPFPNRARLIAMGTDSYTAITLLLCGVWLISALVLQPNIAD